MDDLTDQQYEELTEQLGRLKEELEAGLEEARDSAKPVDLDNPIGRLSRMDAMQQQQMEDAHKRRIELRLERVKVALIAVERDEYGDCQLCEEPIGYKRLKIVPESPICVSCQEDVEKR